MEFKKKLQKRLAVHILWGLFGLVMVLTSALGNLENQFLFPFGIALMVISVIRTIRYRKVAKDEQALRQQELAENDERYQMMNERAKSWALSFYLMISGFAVIVLSLLGYHDAALPIAWSICFLTVLYWLCWLFIQKKY